MGAPLRQRVFAGLVVVAVVVSLVPGVATAQRGPSGTVIVEEGETVSEVDAVAGTVIVRGTVTGDVSAVAGDVHIAGTVEGDLEAAAGTVRISGTVDGDVAAGAGSVSLEDGGTVTGDFDVGAGDVRIDGTVGGNATVGADRISLGETATIAGSLRYDGRLEGNRDAVAGEITRDSTLISEPVTEFQTLTSWLFTLYAFVLNLLLGAALLALFPRFSGTVSDRVAADPIRTGLIGLGAVISVPVVLALTAVTVIGLPFSLIGTLVFAFVAWVGLVYGRFAVGAWLLSLVDVDNRWLALVSGLLLGTVLSLIPLVGGVLNFLVFLLGLGALVWALYAHRRLTDTPPPTARSEESPVN